MLSSHTGLFVCFTLRVMYNGWPGDDAVYSFTNGLRSAVMDFVASRSLA